jgi:hypothetical protein
MHKKESYFQVDNEQVGALDVPLLYAKLALWFRWLAP